MKASEYAKTLVLVAAVLFFTLQNHAGYLVIFVLPFVFLSLIVGTVLMVRRPQERQRRGIRMLIWASALALIGAVQWYRADAARADAEGAVRAIVEHKARSGSYPSTLAQAGLDEEALHARWTLRYSLKNGRPALSYAATLIPTDGYDYDFESSQWIYNSY